MLATKRDANATYWCFVFPLGKLKAKMEGKRVILMLKKIFALHARNVALLHGVGVLKSCWQRFLLLTSHSWGCFRFTSISSWAGLTNWQSLTKLGTGLQVEIQMTELLALLEQTDLLTLNVLTSWLILLMLWTLQTLLQRTGLPTVDGLTR